MLLKNGLSQSHTNQNRFKFSGTCSLSNFGEGLGMGLLKMKLA